MNVGSLVSERVRSGPFKVGLALDATGLVSADGATPSWADILAVAQRAEALGFASLWLPDHLLLRQGAMSEEGNSVMGAWECWSLLAALAAATKRVELGTIVLSTSFRNPALLAKMADTVDEISGGRLILGLGAGWHEPEYRAFGYPYDHRASRFEEALTITATLLREGRIDFVGRYYEARECELRPRGPRPGGPPIMVGTRGPRMMERLDRRDSQPPGRDRAIHGHPRRGVPGDRPRPGDAGADRLSPCGDGRHMVARPGTDPWLAGAGGNGPAGVRERRDRTCPDPPRSLLRV
jgi:hypothetical protein